MIAPSGKQITIATKDQQAVVVEVGGGLRSYSVGGRELLDGYSADEMSSSGRGQVLIPWPNRLQDGSYEFDGLRYQLPLNEPEHRNAIHGLGLDHLYLRCRNAGELGVAAVELPSHATHGGSDDIARAQR